ncbi:delta-latroinsectotoxin-Lt1a-like [Nasonia vitripennis]|uniref:Uncharacterized protein n=1 Tax=Nasonia vitripennis TaxID=7425 RepID=A0A7M7QF05_NASVI|nr:delta-latroinsectotoxin-Lt1a-like [Nasonia vitripennis]
MNRQNVLESLIEKAIRAGDISTVKSVLPKVDVNLRLCSKFCGEEDFTLLHLAVQQNQKEIVKLLLDYQADVGAKDSLGRTPLHLACGIPRAIVDVIKTPHILSEIEQHCIDIAETSLEIVQSLVEQRSCIIDEEDNNGETPLFHILRDDTSNTGNQSLNSIHDLAFIFNLRTVKSAIIEELINLQHRKMQILLSNNANADTLLPETNDTILHRAIIDLESSRDLQQFAKSCFADKAHTDMVKAILNHDITCDVNAKNNLGEAPISVAASLLSADIVRVLEDRGADVQEAKLEHFRYPRVLPCLEAVVNLLDIIDFREEKGFPLSPNENRAVLKFLLCNNEDCCYADSDNDIASYKLQNLLHYGTECNSIMTLEKMSTEKGYSRELANRKVKEYLVKLTAISESRISPNLKEHLQKRILEDSPSTEARIRKKCKHDLDEMEKFIFNHNGKSLKDILTAPMDKFNYFYEEHGYREFYQLNSYKEDFSHFLHMIDGIFAKNLVRLHVRKITEDYFPLQLLPEPCWRNTYLYLSSEHLLNMIQASILDPQEDIDNKSVPSRCDKNSSPYLTCFAYNYF